LSHVHKEAADAGDLFFSDLQRLLKLSIPKGQACYVVGAFLGLVPLSLLFISIYDYDFQVRFCFAGAQLFELLHQSCILPIKSGHRFFHLFNRLR
jgi:hypothetical protein